MKAEELKALKDRVSNAEVLMREMEAVEQFENAVRRLEPADLVKAIMAGVYDHSPNQKSGDVDYHGLVTGLMRAGFSSRIHAVLEHVRQDLFEQFTAL